VKYAMLHGSTNIEFIILRLEWRIIVIDAKYEAARYDCGFCQHWHYEPCDKLAVRQARGQLADRECRTIVTAISVALYPFI